MKVGADGAPDDDTVESNPYTQGNNPYMSPEQTGGSTAGGGGMGNTMADNPGPTDTPGDNMPDVGNETPAFIPLTTKPQQMPAGQKPSSQPPAVMVPGGTPMGMGAGAPMGGANLMGGVQ